MPAKPLPSYESWTILGILAVNLISFFVWIFFFSATLQTDTVFDTTGRYKFWDIRLHYDAAQVHQDPQALRALPYTYPPPVAFLFSFFAGWGYAVFYKVWFILSLAAALAANLLLLKFYQPRHLLLGAVNILTFPAILHSLWAGQNSNISLFLVVAAALVLKRAPILAGVILGCLFFKPQICGFTWLILLFLGQYRAALALAVTGSAWILGGIFISGFDVFLNWISYILSNHAYYNFLNTTWNGFFFSLNRFTGIPVALYFLPSILMVGVAAWLARTHLKPLPPDQAFLLLVPTFCVVSPYSGSYELTLAIPALLLVQNLAFDHGLLRWSWLFIALSLLGFAAITSWIHEFCFGALIITPWLFACWFLFTQSSTLESAEE